MGVRGLRSFIRRKGDKLLHEFKLQDTKLVIDGSNLLYFLHLHYEAGSVYGGNYDHFSKRCTDFFKALLKCNVTPIVVFDGADDPDNRKLETIFKRLDEHFMKVNGWQHTEELLPVLSKITLCQVLTELNIPHISCVYEADKEIAVLANKCECPVLSDDSDFCVYNLRYGCISMGCTVGSVRTDSVGRFYLPVKLYRCQVFLKEVFGTENDYYILPVFATLVGNDIFDPSSITLTDPKNRGHTLCCARRNTYKVIEWICNVEFESGEAALEQISSQISEEKREQFKKSVDSYLDIDEFYHFNLEAFLNRPEPLDVIILKDRNGNQLPFWFVETAIECKMDCSFMLNVAQNHRVIFKAQAERNEQLSSFKCSTNIRRVIYRLVLSQQKKVVKEYHRRKADISDVKPVKSLDFISKLPCLETIPLLSEIERKNIVYASLDADPESFDIETDETSQILILMLSLWKANSYATECHLNALIIGILALHIFSPTASTFCTSISKAVEDTDIDTTVEFKKRMEKHFFNQSYLALYAMNKKFIHCISQFQAIFLHTYHLNQLLLSPVRIPNPCMILNSTFDYNICHLLENNVEPKNIFLGEESPLYRLMIQWKTAIKKRSEVLAKHDSPTHRSNIFSSLREK